MPPMSICHQETPTTRDSCNNWDRITGRASVGARRLLSVSRPIRCTKAFSRTSKASRFRCWMNPLTIALYRNARIGRLPSTMGMIEERHAEWFGIWLGALG